MDGISKYIFFKEIGKTDKTVLYGIFSKENNIKLGMLKWFGRWRKYCFFPEPNTVYCGDCLVDIQKFLDVLNLQHREVKSG